MKKLLISLLVFVGISLSLIGGLHLTDTSGDSFRELAAVGQNAKWYIHRSGDIEKNNEGGFTPNLNVNSACSAYLISCTADGKTVWVVYSYMWGLGASSNLAISNDGGKRFVTVRESDRVEGIALSKDGSVGYVVLSGGNLNRFKKSVGRWENNIWSFKREASMGNEVWHLKSIACTADGKDVWMIAKNTTSNGNDTVWKSIDYGRNFSRIGLTESRRSLECIVVSDDGGCVYIPMLDSGSAYSNGT